MGSRGGFGSLGVLGKAGGSGPAPVVAGAAAFTNSGAISPFAAVINPGEYDPTTDTTWMATQATDGLNLTIQVRVFNNSATTPVVVGPDTIAPLDWGPQYHVMTLMATTFQGTNHGYPSICKAPNGTWHIFGGTWFNAALQHATTTTAGDPSAWTQLAAVGNTTTDALNYPQCVTVGTVMYLFCQTAPISAFSLHTSSDNGATWSAPIAVADCGTNNEWFPSNYLTVGTDIWFLCTRGNAGAVQRDAVYLMRYDTVTPGLKNVDASLTVAAASFPVTATQLNTSFTVVGGSGTSGGVGASLAIDGNGIPNVLYALIATQGGTAFANFDMEVKSFSGGVWTVDATGLGTTSASFNSIGLIKEGDGSLTAYWPQVNATLQGLGIQSGGDIAKAHKPLGGSWGSNTIIQVGGQTTGAYGNPNGPFPLDACIPIKNGKSNLNVVWTECIAGGVTSGASFTGQYRSYAYANGSYRSPSTPCQVFSFFGTTGFLAKLIGKPTKAQCTNYDNLLNALFTNNSLFARGQTLLVPAAHSQQAALVNLIPPHVPNLTTITYADPVLHGTPNFTAFRGFQGNGTSDYIDFPTINENTLQPITNYQQNSASGFAYTLNATSNNLPVMGGGTVGQLIVQYSTNTAGISRVNTSAGSSSVVTTNQIGLLVADRTGAALQSTWWRGTQGANDATASSSNPTSTINVLGINAKSQWSNQRVAAAGSGLGIGAGNAALWAALHAYMIAVGADV
jgi:hypothetical protein